MKNILSLLGRILLVVVLSPFILLCLASGNYVYCPDKNNRHIGPDGGYYPNLIFGPKGEKAKNDDM